VEKQEGGIDYDRAKVKETCKRQKGREVPAKDKRASATGDSWGSDRCIEVIPSGDDIQL